jgi:hypothetical protein
MLQGIHLLLTYTCTYECDHCFLHCGPHSKGTFTLQQLRAVFEEIRKIESVRMVYFEGGEPFLYYPLLLVGLRMARDLGLETGIVTNAYWATSVEDAGLWLKPIRALEISDLSISDDAFHHGAGEDNPAQPARDAANQLGIPGYTLCTAIGENVRFRGRAAEKLTGDLPTRPASEFTACLDEDLENPQRVHLDSSGQVHLCQGLSLGNFWKTPLSTLIRDYDAHIHPICGPLLAGGPAQLARQYGVPLSGYVDECHCCYAVRRALLDRFPEYLAPRQVYGIVSLSSVSEVRGDQHD